MDRSPARRASPLPVCDWRALFSDCSELTARRRVCVPRANPSVKRATKVDRRMRRPRRGDVVRGRLLEFIAQRPGINQSRLCAALGLSGTGGAFHVRVLERTGRISVVRRGSARQLYLADVPSSHRVWLRALDDELARRLMRALTGGRAVGDLSRDIGQARRVIHRHLHRLAREGVVYRVTHRPATYALLPLPQGLNVSHLDMPHAMDGIGTEPPTRADLGRGRQHGAE